MYGTLDGYNSAPRFMDRTLHKFGGNEPLPTLDMRISSGIDGGTCRSDKDKLQFSIGCNF